MASRKVQKEKHYDLFESFHVDPNAWPQEPLIDKIVNDLINPKGHERVPGVAVAQLFCPRLKMANMMVTPRGQHYPIVPDGFSNH